MKRSMTTQQYMRRCYMNNLSNSDLISRIFATLVAIFITYLIHALGYKFELYFTLPFWDLLSHFTGGIAIVLALRIIQVYSALSAVISIIILSVIWEISRYTLIGIPFNTLDITTDTLAALFGGYLILLQMKR